jgi:hypothetical protein
MQIIRVKTEKARTVLGFEASYDVSDIIEDLHGHRDQYKSLDSEEYYNIRVFRRMNGSPALR